MKIPGRGGPPAPITSCARRLRRRTRGPAHDRRAWRPRPGAADGTLTSAPAQLVLDIFGAPLGGFEHSSRSSAAVNGCRAGSPVRGHPRRRRDPSRRRHRRRVRHPRTVARAVPAAPADGGDFSGHAADDRPAPRARSSRPRSRCRPRGFHPFLLGVPWPGRPRDSTIPLLAERGVGRRPAGRRVALRGRPVLRAEHARGRVRGLPRRGTGTTT